MATFSVVVSDPETGQSYTREVEGQDANRFMGREIGESVDGTAVGLDGFTVEITGGSDDAGRPMRPDVAGSDLSEVLLTGGVGYKPERDGERRRITVRGREVGEPITQLNVSVTEGEGSVAVALGEAEPEEVETETAEEADTTEDEDETADEDEEEPEADEDEEETAEEEDEAEAAETEETDDESDAAEEEDEAAEESDTAEEDAEEDDESAAEDDETDE